jgi:hypothetical protein
MSQNREPTEHEREEVVNSVIEHALMDSSYFRDIVEMHVEKWSDADILDWLYPDGPEDEEGG